MAKLFLHAGGFKTGSTAIQAYLSANRAVLGDRGLVVPITGTDAGGRHLPLVRALLGVDVAPKIARAPQMLIEELAAEPDQAVVISCETLEAQLPATLPFFRSLGRELKVVLYVRNQPQKLNSGYVQEARMLRARHSFHDSVVRALADTRLRYSAWLARSDLAADEIIFRPYTGTVRSDVIADFLTTLGIDVAGLPPTAATRENMPMSAVAVAALRMLSRWAYDEALVVKAKARNQIIEVVEQADAKLGLPPFQGFDAAVFDHVVRNYYGDNAWFAHTVWGRSWADQFAEDMAPLDKPNEIDIDGEQSSELREARRLFRTIREAFRAGAEVDSDEDDPLPDLGVILEREIERMRASD